MKVNRKNRIKIKRLILKLLIIAIVQLIVISSFTTVIGDDDNGNSNSYGQVKKAAKNNKPTFIYVNGYEPWAVKVTNAGNPYGVEFVTVDFDESSKVLTITAQDTNTTNKATILVNKLFLNKYITNITDNLEFKVSEAVDYHGLDTSNVSEGTPAVYVFHIKHFSAINIIISLKGYISPTTSISQPSTISLTDLIGILVALTVVITAAIYMLRQEKSRW